jgi:hypothetical protein
MDLIRDPSMTAVVPAYTADGSAGYAKDDGTTVLAVQTVNHLLRELEQAITDTGASLLPLVDNQLSTILKTFSMVMGAIGVSTGKDSTRADRGLIASAGSCVSGALSALVGSANAELNSQGCLAGGVSGVPLVEAGDNQNLQWKLDGSNGEAHVGSVKVGGNVDDGTGATLTINGATGDLNMDGDLAVDGDAQVDGTLNSTGNLGTYGKVSSIGGYEAPYQSAEGVSVEINQPSGEVNASTCPIVPGASFAITIANEYVDADSIVLAVVTASVDGKPVVTETWAGAGEATVVVTNIHASETVVSLYLRFVVLNPATP